MITFFSGCALKSNSYNPEALNHALKQDKKPLQKEEAQKEKERIEKKKIRRAELIKKDKELKQILKELRAQNKVTMKKLSKKRIREPLKTTSKVA
jgi:hypothetical protein